MADNEDDYSSFTWTHFEGAYKYMKIQAQHVYDKAPFVDSDDREYYEIAYQVLDSMADALKDAMDRSLTNAKFNKIVGGERPNLFDF